MGDNVAWHPDFRWYNPFSWGKEYRPDTTGLTPTAAPDQIEVSDTATVDTQINAEPASVSWVDYLTGKLTTTNILVAGASVVSLGIFGWYWYYKRPANKAKAASAVKSETASRHIKGLNGSTGLWGLTNMHVAMIAASLVILAVVFQA